MRFLIIHRRVLSFGLLCALLSGFGQTFFVSLFVPSICERLGWQPGQFGPLYAGATMASGFLLAWIGRWYDERGEVPVFLFAGGSLLVGMVVMALGGSLFWMLVAVFALRLGGQGVMGLISSTTMARHFQVRRGTALSIASIGYALGEMTLPALVVTLLIRINWGVILLLLAVLLTAGVFLGWRILLRQPLRGDCAEQEQSEVGSMCFRWYRDGWFLLVTAITGLTGSFSATILFLYQLPIAEMKGWTEGWMAAGFAFFAGLRLLLSLTSGIWIDRWSGRRLFPWMFIPLPMALGALRWGESPWFAIIYYTGFGMGFGMFAAHTAWLAERYGARMLGQVRGTANAAIVLFSAAGPFVAGLLLQRGWSLLQIIDGLGILSLAAAVVAIWMSWLRGDGSSG